MAPSATEVVEEAPVSLPIQQKAVTSTEPPRSSARNTLPAPLKIGADSQLLSYPHFDAAVSIGTDFPRGSVQITSLLSAPNADDLLRDLAALVAQRGVVFFRAQHITQKQQEELVQRLGELSGKPETSKLHIHPFTPENSNLGDTTYPITSKDRERLVTKTKIDFPLPFRKTYKFDAEGRASSRWHSDISYEPVPSDYATLKIHTDTARIGGDTIWASGYEAYDRLSPRYKQLLEGLYALHDGYSLNLGAAEQGYGIRESRGAPENSGQDVSPLHPIIRTNPVTGWKSLFFNSLFVNRILGVTKAESDFLIQYLHRLITDNPDLQVRFRWQQYNDDPTAHDVAIWDNRSALHTATDDFFEVDGERTGDRAVSLGERPYFDPRSKSRRDDLGRRPHRELPDHEEILRELRGY